MQHPAPKQRISFLEIKELNDYRGFRKIYCLTPWRYPSIHMGYLDDMFFFFERIMIDDNDPATIVDHYLDNIDPFFRNSELEKNYIYINRKYKRYLNLIEAKKQFSERRENHNPKTG